MIHALHSLHPFHGLPHGSKVDVLCNELVARDTCMDYNPVANLKSFRVAATRDSIVPKSYGFSAP
jgi:hypothetical protein